MSPLPPDPYKILGVSKDARTPEIRTAHRKLVLKCHPDKVLDPTLKAAKQDEFQRVQQAYELLTNDQERQKYDDKVKLEELRKQFQNKANISSPRPGRYSGPDEARGTESRSSPFAATASPSGVKYSYTTSFSDEDLNRGARIFEAAPRSSRREGGYTEKPSKRESERERERRRQQQQQEESSRRLEKEAKEARRADKRAREKQMAKDLKRQSEEKKRLAKPYIETFDDEPQAIRPEKKKSSSSRKHEEKRDRSSGREDMPTAGPHPPRPQRSWTTKEEYAASYIQASKAKSVPGLQRAATYHVRTVQPPAPTPPPIPGQSGPFATPDEDDARRSSARPRRGSGEGPRLSRERSYRGSSREPLDDPPIINVSPSTRHTAQFVSPGSPPRSDLPRTRTMPQEPLSYSRTPPGLSRSQTFTVFESPDHARGRDRSRMHAQVDLESDSEDYDRHRDRKHRSSRRHHSPEHVRTENVSRYQVDGSRSRLHSTYSRRIDPEIVDSYGYFHPQEFRPSMSGREASYSAPSGTKYPKVKTSKAYGYDDIQYSYYEKPSREEPMAYA